jgi:hypothetical protein
VIEGGAFARRRLLGDVCDDPVRRHPCFARIGVEFTADQGEQAGFAGTVGPGDADPLAGVDGQVHVPEEDARPPAQGETGKGEHGGGV